ncbi:hypothetical protein Ocin01_01153 [Orchesella cincta]|uniref:Uncharacterized protein n=1 Tax=Orchesella cincta TaxID=48709 RepID=A0A1D2NJU4_ORCCI|nr:hypothetical protein Ocin01_01153 [Orchesella cincta]
MQIALNNTEDYEPDGIFRENALWTILPAESGENDYFLKVLSLPEGILTYSKALSWGGRYLELDLSHPEYYQPGETMHTSSLWNIESTELPECFTVHNSDERRNLNFLTFSNEPSINGQLMQIGTKDIHLYEPKGQFRNDALWNFRPANFVLTVKVCKFEYELPSPEELKNLAIPIRVTDKITLVNDTDNSHVEIDEDVKLNETFVCCFLQSFKAFQEENITVDCDIYKRITGSDSNSSMTFEKLTNTQWCASGERPFPIKQRLLLSPEETANVTGYLNWVHNIEIPFTATVEVRATSDVAYCPTPVQLHRINTNIKEWEIVEYLLKYERFTGKIMTRDKKSEEGVVYCQVSGRFKAGFGLDTKLEVKYI